MDTCWKRSLYQCLIMITILNLAPLEYRCNQTQKTPVRDNQHGTYTASTAANQTGKVSLLVRIDGEHVEGSTYSVQVHQCLTLDKPTKMEARMGHPWHIAFGKDSVWAISPTIVVHI